MTPKLPFPMFEINLYLSSSDTSAYPVLNDAAGGLGGFVRGVRPLRGGPAMFVDLSSTLLISWVVDF